MRIEDISTKKLEQMSRDERIKRQYIEDTKHIDINDYHQTQLVCPQGCNKSVCTLTLVIYYTNEPMTKEQCQEIIKQQIERMAPGSRAW